jgi:Mn2+/Fe2+ NRAMP family transporter
MSATGITLHAMLPVFADASDGKIVFGIAAALIGLGLVWLGGYRLFERVMQVCIGVMFVTVVVTAVLLWPGTGAVLEGLVVPRIPDAATDGLTWTVALIGGIGGTFTVLCYGYWLREEGRTRPEDLPACRADLAMSYAMTAVFGIAMVIVGSTITVEGEGTQLLVALSERLGQELGPFGKWLFLAGTLGTVFSSLLGVWQAVPYLFADCWRLMRRREAAAVDTASAPYRIYLVALAIVPIVGLFYSFREVQKVYTVSGAYLFPVLALALLVFNGRASWAGERYVNRPVTAAALVGVLAFFSWLALANIQT